MFKIGLKYIQHFISGNFVELHLRENYQNFILLYYNEKYVCTDSYNFENRYDGNKTWNKFRLDIVTSAPETSRKPHYNGARLHIETLKMMRSHFFIDHEYVIYVLLENDELQRARYMLDKAKILDHDNSKSVEGLKNYLVDKGFIVNIIPIEHTHSFAKKRSFMLQTANMK